MNLEGATVRLRALEPNDIEQMYVWENDPEIWRVSGTTTPFSRHTLEHFIEQQQFDIFQTRQQRLVIETLAGVAIGALDLFDFDPLNHRAGIGILIYGSENRGKGYAADAIEILCRYGREVLCLHQLWCNIAADNAASLALFRKAAFSQAGIKRDWLWTPSGYFDEITMQKIL
ncbi:MAG: GNAT family protein [Alistipes sp.]